MELRVISGKVALSYEEKLPSKSGQRTFLAPTFSFVSIAQGKKSHLGSFIKHPSGLDYCSASYYLCPQQGLRHTFAHLSGHEPNNPPWTIA